MAEENEQQPQQDEAAQAVAEPETAEAGETATAVEETQPQPARTAPEPPEGRHYFWGTGRRKSSIARVRIRPGEGSFKVNGKEVDEFFSEPQDRAAVIGPLETVNMRKSWDVQANVQGGGHTGQAGAIVLGLARALRDALPDTEEALRDNGLLTRDARMKERKKYGQPGARKRFQFSKR